jgi:hypothetical protein
MSKGATAAPVAPKPDHPASSTVAATVKKLNPEEQAKLDAEINASLAGKKVKTPKGPTAPRSGAAPDGKTWVQWFRDVIAGGMAVKDAEAAYFELRKAEPAYSGEGGDKKLKRHAYHHRVLALEEKTAPAAE